MAGSLDEPGHEGGGGMRARRCAGTRRDARRRYRRACRRDRKEGRRSWGSSSTFPRIELVSARNSMCMPSRWPTQPVRKPTANQNRPRTALQTNFACEAKISLANWKISLAKRLISLAKRLSSLQAIEIVGVENFRFRRFVRF